MARSRAFLAIVLLLSLGVVVGCERKAATPVDLEIRDLATKEEKKDTSYTNYNSFITTGKLVVRDARFQGRSAFVLFLVTDQAEGSETTEPQQLLVLVTDGIGDIELHKSDFASIVPAPKYSFKATGWFLLEPPGSVTVK